MAYIDAALRRLVTERAESCCEYCLIDQQDSPFSFHIEHIISEKHGGETHAENLCLSCPECNAFKGSDIGSIDRETGLLTPLFNPRTQAWTEHFRLEGTQIIALSAEGRVTTYLLRLNSTERIAERILLIQLNRYPGKNRKSP